MRGAIIGFGFIAANGHLPAYLKMKNVEIVAAADITPVRLDLAREMLPRANFYNDYKELLDSEELDFVDIATPPALHAEMAIAALQRGIHVLCEKPLAISSQEALNMTRTARENRAVLFPVHNYKHAPAVKRVRELIESGVPGKVTSATLSTFRFTHARGAPEWRPDWRREKKYSGGGVAMDHGSHSLYLTFLFFGDFPQTVSARTFRRDDRWDTEDSMTCVLEFQEGFAHVYLSWTAGARKVVYSVQGDRGALFTDEDELQIGRLSAKTERERIVSSFDDASHTSWFAALFAQFTAGIAENDHVGRELIEAYACVRIIEKIYESAALDSKALSLDFEEDFLSRRV